MLSQKERVLKFPTRKAEGFNPSPINGEGWGEGHSERSDESITHIKLAVI